MHFKLDCRIPIKQLFRKCVNPLHSRLRRWYISKRLSPRGRETGKSSDEPFAVRVHRCVLSRRASGRLAESQGYEYGGATRERDAEQHARPSLAASLGGRPDRRCDEAVAPRRARRPRGGALASATPRPDAASQRLPGPAGGSAGRRRAAGVAPPGTGHRPGRVGAPARTGAGGRPARSRLQADAVADRPSARTRHVGVVDWRRWRRDRRGRGGHAVPELFCPGPVRDNAALGEEVSNRVVDRAQEVGIYPGQLDRLRSCAFGHLIMLTHPTTDDPDRLLAAAKCVVAEWAADDYFNLPRSSPSRRGAPTRKRSSAPCRSTTSRCACSSPRPRPSSRPAHRRCSASSSIRGPGWVAAGSGTPPAAATAAMTRESRRSIAGLTDFSAMRTKGARP